MQGRMCIATIFMQKKKSGKWRISSGYYLMKNLQLFDSLVSRMVAASFAYIKITNKGLVTQKSQHCTFTAILIILAICQHIYECSHDINLTPNPNT